MKKILSFLCAIFLLQSACAVPVETDVSTRGLLDGIINFVFKEASAITDFGLSIFSNVMQNMQTFVNTTVTGVATLANDSLQALSNTTKQAIDVFKNAAAIPGSIGPKIHDALNNKSPGSGAQAINDNLNNLVAKAGASVDMTAAVGGKVGAIKQDLGNLANAVKGVSDNLAAATKAATSGLNAIFPKSLMKVLGDPTLTAIQEAIKAGAGVINNSTTAFVAAVQNNPFRTFVNDILTATTKDGAASALAATQNVVSQLMSDAKNAVTDVAAKKIDNLNSFVPGAIADVEKLLATVNSTVATSLAAAKALSADQRAAIQTQLQSAIGDLAGVVQALKSNLAQAIPAIGDKITSDVQGTIKGVTGLATDVTKGVFTTIITAKLQARDAAISALMKLVGIAQDGLGGVKKCVVDAIGSIKNSVKAMVGSLQGSAALVAQNVGTCINMTSAVDMAVCFNVSS